MKKRANFKTNEFLEAIQSFLYCFNSRNHQYLTWRSEIAPLDNDNTKRRKSFFFIFIVLSTMIVVWTMQWLSTPLPDRQILSSMLKLWKSLVCIICSVGKTSSPESPQGMCTMIYTVNNKKTRTPCFSTLRFSRISPAPLNLQKIYLRLFISVFKELSVGTEIFTIQWHNQLILAKMLIFQ